MGTESDTSSATTGALTSDVAPVICPFATINIKLHVPMTLELKPSNFTKWSTVFQATCGKFGLLHHLATASTSRSDEALKQADFCVRGWMYSTVSDAILNLAMTDDTQTASGHRHGVPGEQSSSRHLLESRVPLDDSRGSVH
jgi:hypothetical protein